VTSYFPASKQELGLFIKALEMNIPIWFPSDGTDLLNEEQLLVVGYIQRGTDRCMTSSLLFLLIAIFLAAKSFGKSRFYKFSWYCILWSPSKLIVYNRG